MYKKLKLYAFFFPMLGCLVFLSFIAKAHAIDFIAYQVPNYADIKSNWQGSDIKILAADGRILQTVRTNFKYRKGDWLGLEDISPALQKAIIASEDKRFYQHTGVDWLATVAAAWSSLAGSTVRGASTITMQLAAMLEPELKRSAGGRSIATKIDQMQLAQLIENKWSKSEILEAYINLANYKGELVGVDILARVMFRKHANSLNLRESALAAVLLRGPNANYILLNNRTCALLSTSFGRGDLCKGLDFFILSVINRTQESGFLPSAMAPHFAMHFTDSTKREIRSDINYDLQKYANYVVRQNLLDLKSTGITDAAVLVLDNASGAILAYVGSSGDLSQAKQLDHILAKRQAGSTLKPFLYALALDQQYITAASLLNDAPLDINVGGGLYIPDNYDHIFTGWVSVRNALSSSLNIPAVRVLTMVGVAKFSNYLKKIGLPIYKPGDYYGFSLALGSADVDLLSLTNAYRVFARGGNYQSVLLPEASHNAFDVQIMSPEAAWITADILSDRQARARTFGLDSALATPYWTAVKTGTSRDMRDNWTIGWSDKFTVGVWVGNSAGASMRNVSGVTGAGPIWRDIFNFLNKNNLSIQPSKPEAVKQLNINFANNLEPKRVEYFIGDTGMVVVRQVDFSNTEITKAVVDKQFKGTISVANAVLHIVEPVDGTILALDADIPLSKQKMLLLANNIHSADASFEAHWYLNGQYYASGNKAWWSPKPGRHIFELRDDLGQVLDESRLTVRANY